MTAPLRKHPWWRIRISSNMLAIALTAAAVLAGAATYAMLTTGDPAADDPGTVYGLLNLDLVLLLLLAAVIARRLVKLVIGGRRGKAGARLHMQMVGVFSFLAAAPAIIMTIFSAVYFHVGIESWFAEKVRTAVDESIHVAEAYLKEHQQTIRADILAMSSDLDRVASSLIGHPDRMEQLVKTQAMLRDFNEAMVFDSTGKIIARSGLTFAIDFDPIPDEQLDRARAGDVVIVTSDMDNRVRALV
ncbi:MAG: two-component sensor histidine kinase, partial [Pseudomonadota bacterium]|nr:two-component sensor histidine kinase [Pseudomonadota bacterium]